MQNKNFLNANLMDFISQMVQYGRYRYGTVQNLQYDVNKTIGKRYGTGTRTSSDADSELQYF
jgi:hypothetical protein